MIILKVHSLKKMLHCRTFFPIREKNITQQKRKKKKKKKKKERERERRREKKKNSKSLYKIDKKIKKKKESTVFPATHSLNKKINNKSVKQDGFIYKLNKPQ
ncbi:hypothetical protein HMI56_005741 [Coelomomyces lativittatus]|nr:hypothetical protein HMI56_005741 [Coelomomyces lativittatus]